MEKDNEYLYVVFALQYWERLETNIGIPVNTEAMPDSPGFLPVFNSREAAEREYPGHSIHTIKTL